MLKILGQVQVADGTKLYALSMLRELAGASSQVPKSYLVGKYIVKDGVIASGGFADIREGKLGEKVVAVKVIRMSEETKVDVIYKVRKLPAGHSDGPSSMIDRPGVPNPGLLQGMRPLDEHIPP